MPADGSHPDQIHDRAEPYARSLPADAGERSRHHHPNLPSLTTLPGMMPGQRSVHRDAIGSGPRAGKSTLPQGALVIRVPDVLPRPGSAWSAQATDAGDTDVASGQLPVRSPGQVAAVRSVPADLAMLQRVLDGLVRLP